MKTTIKNFTFETIGASPVWPAETIELSARSLADALRYEISGVPATEMQVDQLTQEFVERHGIKATYHSGTFIGFKIPDTALDEFETFKK